MSATESVVLAYSPSGALLVAEHDGVVVSDERLAKDDGAVGSIALFRDGVAAIAGAGADIDLWQRGATRR